MRRQNQSSWRDLFSDGEAARPEQSNVMRVLNKAGKPFLILPEDRKLAARFVADDHQWFQAGSSSINGSGISGAAGSQNYDVVYRCIHSIYGNKQNFLLYM